MILKRIRYHQNLSTKNLAQNSKESCGMPLKSFSTKQSAQESIAGRPLPKVPTGLKGLLMSAILLIMKTKGSCLGKNSEINSMKKQRSLSLSFVKHQYSCKAIVT